MVLRCNLTSNLRCNCHSLVAIVCVCTYVRVCVGRALFKSDLISHMWLELKFNRRAESSRVHFHEALAVTTGVQTVHRVFNDVQALVTRRLQVIFGREVSPQSPVQRGMISQITTLHKKKERPREEKHYLLKPRKKYK